MSSGDRVLSVISGGKDPFNSAADENNNFLTILDIVQVNGKQPFSMQCSHCCSYTQFRSISISIFYILG